MSSSKTIAKNTMFLYFRMILVMGVSLYTSRVVLNTLGVEDYGIYNVVGGVIALFGFLTSSMSSATSRFLTYNLGKKENNRLKEVFKASCTIHLILAIVIVILAEVIGLWFMENKLVIPSDRMMAARYVFHNMIISAVLSILQVPYTASVMSHEKMGVYALFEIILTFVRLGIVILLTIISFDKLISYSFLLLFVNILSFVLYMFYSTKKFEECKYGISKKTEYLMPMFTFSGWDLYGNMSIVARTQGVNMLLNIFFGPLMNAANGIAVAVQSAVNSFSGNILLAVKPQIIKRYAQNEIKSMTELIGHSLQITTILLILIITPFIVEIDFVLRLWLKNPPEFANIFSIFTLLFVVFANISSIIMSAIHATGKIKKSSILNGTLYLSVIPISYVAFKIGGHPVVPYAFNVIAVAIGASLNMYYLKSYIPLFSIKKTILRDITPVIIIASVSFLTTHITKQYLSEGWGRLLIIISISSFIIIVSTFLFILNKEQKKYILTKIKIKNNEKITC